MRLMNVSPWGAQRTFTADHSTGKYVVKSTMNIDAVLDENVAAYNDGIHRGEENDFWHVARVPLELLTEWLQEYTAKTGHLLFSPFSDDPDWTRFVYGRLNDPEYRKLRTSPCRI